LNIEQLKNAGQILKNSKRLVIGRLRDEFGDRPDDYNVQASCLKAA
jgi:hypothetical protein